MANPDDPIPPDVDPVEIEVEDVDYDEATDGGPLPLAASPFKSQGSGTVPLEWVATVTHRWDHGIRAAPRCGPAGTQAAVWRAHAGICYRVIEWSAAQVGSVPRIPDPAELCSNEQCMEEEINQSTEFFLPNGSKAKRIGGKYTYVLRKAPLRSDPLATCAVPWDYEGATSKMVTIDGIADKALQAGVNPANFAPPEGMARLAGAGTP